MPRNDLGAQLYYVDFGHGPTVMSFFAAVGSICILKIASFKTLTTININYSPKTQNVDYYV